MKNTYYDSNGYRSEIMSVAAAVARAGYADAQIPDSLARREVLYNANNASPRRHSSDGAFWAYCGDRGILASFPFVEADGRGWLHTYGGVCVCEDPTGPIVCVRG